MKSKKTAILIAAVAFTIASGIIHGRMVQRWGPTHVMLGAAERIKSFPDQIGPWQLQSAKPLSDSALQMLQCTGYVNRVYRHEETGQLVSLVLMVGPAGPLAIHTPEVCYRSNNFSIFEPRRPVSLETEDRGSHDFSVVTFQVNDASGSYLRVYYGWSQGESWVSPSQPRYDFAGSRMLYKVQVASAADISHDGGIDSGRNSCGMHYRS